MRGLNAIFTVILVILAAYTPLAGAEVSLAADNPSIRWSGRHVADEGAVRFGFPSVSANLRISSGSLWVTAHSTKEGSLLSVEVDGERRQRIALTPTSKRYRILENDGQPHTVRVSHVSETWRGIVTLAGFTLSGGELLAPPPAPKRRLMLIGDSVTCGEGVYTPAHKSCDANPRQPDSDHSYGMLLGRALNAETQLVCYGGRGLIRSWNGNTDELQAPQFFPLSIPIKDGPKADLKAFRPDIILISLGTNDFSLGIGPLPEKKPYVTAYVDFVQTLRQHYPDALIALTEGAIVNDSADSTRPQKTVLRDYIAATVAQINSVRVVQIQSDHFPGDSCDAHPTGEQHRKIATQLLPQLQSALKTAKLQ